MKKLIFYISVMSMLTSCGNNNALLIKSSNQNIINESLKLNPIGSSWETVINYCASSKIKCDAYASKGYVHHPNGYSSKRSSVIGEAHIRHSMGSYKNTIFTNLSKTLFWVFDDDKKLIGIWVQQDIDAP